MTRLFIAPDQIDNDVARIVGADHLHLARVLRARPGQQIVLLDNRGNGFRAVLVAVDRAETVARIEGPIELPPEPPVRITVAQALGKGDKFEQVIQHGTEIGASAFIPVRAERSVVEIPVARVAERVARWRQIAKGAAEQSGRALIPEVAGPVSLGDLLRDASEAWVALLHPAPRAIPLAVALQAWDLKRERFHLILAIGPEGGWSPAELAPVETIRPQDARRMAVTLGNRILRTETAALVAISQILYHIEQL